MKEKIEQLCEQIKGLLKQNDREYVVAITPEETYSYPDFTFPECFKNILDSSEYRFNELLFDDSIDVDWEDFVLDELEEPVYVDDYAEADYDDEEYEEEDYILYYEHTEFLLIGIRVESDELLFAVERLFTDDEQTACENVEEVSISSLVRDYGEETVVSVLEAYVRILSDETKKSKFWKI
jgi:hypothetical protein